MCESALAISVPPLPVHDPSAWEPALEVAVPSVASRDVCWGQLGVALVQMQPGLPLALSQVWLCPGAHRGTAFPTGDGLHVAFSRPLLPRLLLGPPVGLLDIASGKINPRSCTAESS